ncbi:Protein-ribulosamine 3-kinase, chloroplastic [Cytospora mali]|uniref:protein-ribulosamine 3-kinase n=1 Tax=Cytospora mali TaxID=578113 RepID=A0A194V1R1_CYTMA|nr:Protein-ribulosamine 3-kinase, chloroplastic [Valsa mali var. pyri (nom. inval.)]
MTADENMADPNREAIPGISDQILDPAIAEGVYIGIETCYLSQSDTVISINEFWQLYDDVVKMALDKLIPRLLDILTKNGQAIRPVLIHGDLWESNIGTDEESGEIYFWDACAYYAHHERDVAMWRCAHHQMTDEKYRGEYFKNYPPSEPRQEADDRNRLYSVEILMNNGLTFPGAKTRQLAVEELRYLIAKYFPEEYIGK